MKTNQEIQCAKAQYADRYCHKSPADYGIIAAVQHGRLYSHDANRPLIRAFWKEQLDSLSAQYLNGGRTEQDFIKDIEQLKGTMNSQFPESFNNGSPEFENGFRIAHAQKSLSICLKHMWCRGQLQSTPPVCPIDGIILRALHCNEAWTKVNYVYEGLTPLYINHLNLVKSDMNAMHYPNLSVWELFFWEDHRQLFNQAITHPNICFQTREDDLLWQRFPHYHLRHNHALVNYPRSVYFGYEIEYEGYSYFLFVGRGRVNGHQTAVCELIGSTVIPDNLAIVLTDILPERHRQYMFTEVDDEMMGVDKISSSVEALADLDNSYIL